jgi:hypothetical protein
MNVDADNKVSAERPDSTFLELSLLSVYVHLGLDTKQ